MPAARRKTSRPVAAGAPLRAVTSVVTPAPDTTEPDVVDDADLTQANFEGADLRGADMLKAELFGASLAHSDLRGANLTAAHLAGATLTDACYDRLTRWPARSLCT